MWHVHWLYKSVKIWYKMPDCLRRNMLTYFSWYDYLVYHAYKIHWGPFYERVINLWRRKCDDLPLAYDGRSTKMALETGPTGTRFQSNHRATTFVSLWWETTLHGHVSEITYDVINLWHVHKTGPWVWFYVRFISFPIYMYTWKSKENP